MYSALLRLMFLLQPERIHHLAFATMRTLTSFAPTRKLLSQVFVVDDPLLRSTVFGVNFPSPLGLAAGFDKNADGVDAWGPLGFGFAEVGTVTAQPQPGNPTPRLFRLPADRALINRMGFNNHGAGNAANVLRNRRGGVPIGANIGKTKVTLPADAAADYTTSATLLGPLSDFLVVNVSSPNTPGLRDLQAVASLRPILEAVQSVVTVPILVKIAPDLSDEDIDAIADLAVELGLDGIVATNTTIDRSGLCTSAEEVEAVGAGGLSGAPLADRSLVVLRRLYARVGTRIALISVGGIESVDQAWERITSGASLIQGYTGFIYGGPFWMRRINKGIALRLRAHGFTSLSDAVGSDHRSS
ncbi:quinone-dependent dihydroorotate dehydrogenase [Rhodococcus sp. PAMC28707]|uniref:quinone-dependent dihydroorotate dehydrogenase n=1 Tax=unclassified Rhodococcus (in: high G+C Gram-positive bacteria) TaxID=192944 RepID=UPI00109DD9BF|nr:MULTISPECIES: quinone-dependent dihydroorotate dehydrogenase [unclassified Rhodococcus (in: high G+C Gram-positive bacteria)]QCB52778.1 quinone-dependent dihydroorotate dehydrogenase [Rhodococcus sp. PAMC28705]QCB60674.1 quinone-dependent dihydroorotate dehydrogenase [Rhodococcus sp. PAMC28707]